MLYEGFFFLMDVDVVLGGSLWLGMLNNLIHTLSQFKLLRELVTLTWHGLGRGRGFKSLHLCLFPICIMFLSFFRVTLFMNI